MCVYLTNCVNRSVHFFFRLFFSLRSIDRYHEHLSIHYFIMHLNNSCIFGSLVCIFQITTAVLKFYIVRFYCMGSFGWNVHNMWRFFIFLVFTNHKKNRVIDFWSNYLSTGSRNHCYTVVEMKPEEDLIETN